MIYFDIFYKKDPRLSQVKDPDVHDPLLDYPCVAISLFDTSGQKAKLAPIDTDQYFHCLVSEEQLKIMPAGWFTLDEAPSWMKRDNGSPRHLFMGRGEPWRSRK